MNRHTAALAALIIGLGGCTATTTACNTFRKIFGYPPKPVQYVKGPAPEYHQFDCTVIVHYPNLVTTTPGGAGYEATGEFTTVPGTTPFEWNELCSKLPAVTLVKSDKSPNNSKMSTIHYMTLHKFALYADVGQALPTWHGKWNVVSMGPDLTYAIDQFREWYFIGEPRP